MNGSSSLARACLIMLPLLFAVEAACAGEELAQQSYSPGIDLPEGEGRALLLAGCVRCHDLRGLPAYKGYWNSALWREMVDAMIKNGAPLNSQQAAVLADYLATHFGRPPATSEQE